MFGFSSAVVSMVSNIVLNRSGLILKGILQDVGGNAAFYPGSLQSIIIR